MTSKDSISVQALIIKELEIVQAEIARFDNNCLTIRSWCLASWTAIIAYGIEKRNPLIIGAALATTFGFALVDVMHRRVQVRFILRSERIENILNNGKLEDYQYAAHRTASGKVNDSRLRTEVITIIKHPYYWFFYLFLMVCALACAIYIRVYDNRDSTQYIARCVRVAFGVFYVDI